MRTPVSARTEAIAYLRIVFAAMPFMYFFAFLQMAQRGAGDSRTPFYFMALAVVLDIILNPLLIAGMGPFPKLGIAGSATSTLIGQGVALVLLMIHLYRRQSIIMLRPNELHLLKPDLRIMRALVLRGLPMGAQMLIISMAAMVMIGFVNHYGALTAAAFVGSQQVWNYIQMPGMAVGAMRLLDGGPERHGAGLWDRVAKVARSGMFGVSTSRDRHHRDGCSICSSPRRSMCSCRWARQPSPLAEHINNMVPLGVRDSRTPPSGLTGAVRATGAVWPPTLILVVSMWLIRIPFATLLTPKFGVEAVWGKLPARHHDLERAVDPVLPLRGLAKEPDAGAGSQRRGAGQRPLAAADGPARGEREGVALSEAACQRP